MLALACILIRRFTPDLELLLPTLPSSFSYFTNHYNTLHTYFGVEFGSQSRRQQDQDVEPYSTKHTLSSGRHHGGKESRGVVAQQRC